MGRGLVLAKKDSIYVTARMPGPVKSHELFSIWAVHKKLDLFFPSCRLAGHI